MSATPHDPRRLPEHRRPAWLGGTGRDPVFFINSNHLSSYLEVRLDPLNPETHVFVEPANGMPAPIYQKALCDTGPRWQELDK